MPAFANEITVGSGCTLAQAINEANGAAKPEGVTCKDGADGTGAAGLDTIVIPSGHAKITITSALPGVESHITIDGNNNTISGGDSTHILDTFTGANLTLRNLTLENGSGDYGGAIHHGRGRLLLDGVVIKDSAITYSGQAGAIFSEGHLTIQNSHFYNNSGVRQGGSDKTSAISHTNGDLTISRSVVANNHGSKAAIFVSPDSTGTITARITNVTIYGNGGYGISFGKITGATATNHVSHVTVKDGINFGASTNHLRNSILYGATNDCVLTSGGTLPTNENNIIGNNGCGGSPSSANPQLPSSPSKAGGALPHFPLPSNSPAVDAAGDCTAYTTTSQNGVYRPQGSACDIGAYERVYVPPPPPPPPTDDLPGDGDGDGDGDSGSSSESSDSASDDDQAPAQLIIPTCLSLPDHISVYNITHLTQCQQVDSSGIGNAAVLGLGFRDGVDVWGWVLHNTQVCFEGSSGSFRFLDAATAPRAVSELPVVGRDGMICTTIDRAGTVALIDGPPVPTPTPVPPPVYSLSGCMVRTQYMLNFRASPGGEIVDILPFDIKLTALERSEGYIKVDYHGARGWISENLVEPIGTCG